MLVWMATASRSGQAGGPRWPPRRGQASPTSTPLVSGTAWCPHPPRFLGEQEGEPGLTPTGGSLSLRVPGFRPQGWRATFILLVACLLKEACSAERSTHVQEVPGHKRLPCRHPRDAQGAPLWRLYRKSRHARGRRPSLLASAVCTCSYVGSSLRSPSAATAGFPRSILEATLLMSSGFTSPGTGAECQGHPARATLPQPSPLHAVAAALNRRVGPPASAPHLPGAVLGTAECPSAAKSGPQWVRARS